MLMTYVAFMEQMVLELCFQKQLLNLTCENYCILLAELKCECWKSRKARCNVPFTTALLGKRPTVY